MDIKSFGLKPNETASAVLFGQQNLTRLAAGSEAKPNAAGNVCFTYLIYKNSNIYIKR